MYKSNLQRIMEMVNETEHTPLTAEQKQEFRDAVRKFSELGDSVYGKGNLQQLCDRVRDIVEKAEQIATESGDWFDGLTVKRHMKTLNDSYKTFEATAKEISQLQQRLSAAYEDIAQGLNKYYEVG